MCRTNLALKCDRVSVTKTDDNAPLLLCSDYSSLLAIVFAYGDRRYCIMQLRIQLRIPSKSAGAIAL